MMHWHLLRATLRAWWEGDAFRMAAALAYYTIVSMAPLLLIVLGVTEFVLGDQRARGELSQRLEGFVGPEPSKAVEAVLGNMQATGSNGLFTGINFAIFLFGAVWVFTAVQDSLNSIWKVPSQTGVSWVLWTRGRLLLFALVLGTGLLLLTMLATSVTLVTVTRFLNTSRLTASLLHGFNVGVSFVLVAFVFALIYRFLPAASVQWRHVWVGALGSSLLHSLGNYGIGLYIGHSALSSIYGAASSVMIILVWVYYSSLGFLLGAEYVHQAGELKTAPLASAERNIREFEAPQEPPQQPGLRTCCTRIQSEEEQA
jgi:membrane protein